jgi:hypothetical protein
MGLVPRTATWEANEMNPSRASSLILAMVLLVSCNRLDAAKLLECVCSCGCSTLEREI